MVSRSFESNKLVIIGESGVGKTQFINVAISPPAPLDLDAKSKEHLRGTTTTIGVGIHSATFVVNRHQTMTLAIWDTAGQERFRVSLRSFLANTRAIVMMYDVTSQKSLTALEQYWHQEALEASQAANSDMARGNIDNTDLHRAVAMAKRPVLFVVGTKTDLTAQRITSAEDARAWAAEINATYFETNVVVDHGNAARITLKLIAETMYNNGVPSDEQQLANCGVTPLDSMFISPSATLDLRRVAQEHERNPTRKRPCCS